jgi:adenosine deaminase
LGIEVSINTDDPGSFATDITSELRIAHDHHGVDLDAIRAMQVAACDHSSMDAASKRRFRSEVTEY